ncbi:hypothetical protein GCM10009809_00120 [Isoptericola hypogeus]|uniref:Uncharacterized protein n=1 Tax=Isoptericola hypogeus TaxID=300179 RepID=A0ABN2IM18_9MICO
MERSCQRRLRTECVVERDGDGAARVSAHETFSFVPLVED